MAKKNQLLSSSANFIQSFSEIDKQNGIIRDVKICSEGEAKSHDVWLDEKFIKDVVKLGKAHKPGIKARFGHPNMCETTFGKYIGRFENFRVDKQDGTEGFEAFDSEVGQFKETDKPPKQKDYRMHAIADLHLDEVAKDLPRFGNAWDHVVNMAENNPDMFGNSIVFTEGDRTFRRWKTDDGVEHSRMDVSIENLIASDIVDSPAATDGMFEQFESNELALQVTNFLNDNPKIYDLAISNPEVIDQFMNKYENYREQKLKTMSDTKKTNKLFDTFVSGIKAAFSSEKDGKTVVDIPEELQSQLSELQSSLDSAEEYEGKLNSLNEKVTGLETELSEANDKVTSLSTELAQAKGESTKPKGLEGEENEDEGKKVNSFGNMSEVLTSLRGETSSQK